MWSIDKKIEDLHGIRGKSYLHLNPDQIMSPYHILYPLIWNGYLNGKRDNNKAN